MKSKELFPPVFSRHARAYQSRLEDIMSRGESAGRVRVPVTSRTEPVWHQLDTVIDRWLPPAPQAVDQAPTRMTVQDAVAFRQSAIDAGFASATVELVEEKVDWQSAEHLVSSFMSWVDYAARIEGIDDDRRQDIMDDAIETLSRDHPGRIETKGRNHVLLAGA